MTFDQDFIDLSYTNAFCVFRKINLDLSSSYGRKKISKRFLSEACPHLLDEWHPELNQHLDPNKVYAGSKTVIWWICSKNKKHVWDTPAYTRSNVKSPKGCPFCAGQRVHPDESLEALYPELAKWWDYSKNVLLPSQVLPGSGKKVFWKCDQGHETERVINKIVKYGTCTKCERKSYKTIVEKKSGVKKRNYLILSTSRVLPISIQNF